MIAGNRKNSSATNLCNNQWGRCSDNNDVNCFLVTWSYDTNQITFTIKAYLERNQWVGIGFNDKQQMVRDFSMYFSLTDFPITVVFSRSLKMLMQPCPQNLDMGRNLCNQLINWFLSFSVWNRSERTSLWDGERNLVKPLYRIGEALGCYWLILL